MLESEIKRQGTKLLESWGYMVVHLIQTNTNGIPDSLCLKNTKCFFIEWKQPRKKPQKLQEYRIEKLDQQGFKTYVITDLKQLEPLR